MGGLCLCSSWTCRPLWSLFIFLAATPCFFHCSESSAAVVGKMYTRGNHWAVGHLMGKKSIKNQAEVQEENLEKQHLTPSESVRISKMNQQEKPLWVLQANRHKQMIPDRLLHFHRNWREEDRAKYLKELSHLLLLALELQDIGSS